MEKKIKYGNLFAFYGKLLTEKQYEMLYYYYLNDYSMVEIAENMKISRQAVYDAVKKSNSALDNYEMKMGLWEKFKKISDSTASIIEPCSRQAVKQPLSSSGASQPEKAHHS